MLGPTIIIIYGFCFLSPTWTLDTVSSFLSKTNLFPSTPPPSGRSQFVCPGPGLYPGLPSDGTTDCQAYIQCMFKGLYPFSYMRCEGENKFDRILRKCIQGQEVKCDLCSTDGVFKDEDYSDDPQRYIRCEHRIGVRVICPSGQSDPSCQSPPPSSNENSNGNENQFLPGGGSNQPLMDSLQRSFSKDGWKSGPAAIGLISPSSSRGSKAMATALTKGGTQAVATVRSDQGQKATALSEGLQRSHAVSAYNKSSSKAAAAAASDGASASSVADPRESHAESTGAGVTGSTAMASASTNNQSEATSASDSKGSHSIAVLQGDLQKDASTEPRSNPSNGKSQAIATVRDNGTEIGASSSGQNGNLSSMVLLEASGKGESRAESEHNNGTMTFASASSKGADAGAASNLEGSQGITSSDPGSNTSAFAVAKNNGTHVSSGSDPLGSEADARSEATTPESTSGERKSGVKLGVNDPGNVSYEDEPQAVSLDPINNNSTSSTGEPIVIAKAQWLESENGGGGVSNGTMAAGETEDKAHGSKSHSEAGRFDSNSSLGNSSGHASESGFEGKDGTLGQSSATLSEVKGQGIKAKEFGAVANSGVNQDEKDLKAQTQAGTSTSELNSKSLNENKTSVSSAVVSQGNGTDVKGQTFAAVIKGQEGSAQYENQTAKAKLESSSQQNITNAEGKELSSKAHKSEAESGTVLKTEKLADGEKKSESNTKFSDAENSMVSSKIDGNGITKTYSNSKVLSVSNSTRSSSVRQFGDENPLDKSRNKKKRRKPNGSDRRNMTLGSGAAAIFKGVRKLIGVNLKGSKTKTTSDGKKRDWREKQMEDW